MTYGWAILVVLAAIGALAYFGILSPSKFLPNSCMLSGGFSCTQYKITNSTVSLGIQNNLGVNADQVNISLGCAGGSGMQAYTNVANSAAVNATGVVFTCTSTGTKVKYNFNVTYVRSGDTLSHTTTGTIQSGIET